MKVIVAGSRHFTGKKAFAVVCKVLDELHATNKIAEVVSGAAPGADTLGERWAKKRGVTLVRFPAQWQLYGKAHAGKKRNMEMGGYADMLVAFWDGKSPGTRHMVIHMITERKKPTLTLFFDGAINGRYSSLTSRNG